MRVGRTLPPAAAPIPWATIFRSLPACLLSDESNSLFESEVKEEFESKYCFTLSSGKAALTIILRALQKLNPAKNQVLIPAFTCYSVPAAIKRAGLQIRLCDMGDKSLDFDKEQLKKILEADKKNNRILCVLVTHLFGCPADVEMIKKLVDDQIPIVEDAAQAMGEMIGDKKLGALGDVGFFSLGRGKALSAMEGGVIVTNRKDLGEQLAVLYGEIKSYGNIEIIKLAVKTVLVTALQHPILFWIPKSVSCLKLGETIYEEQFSIRKMSLLQKRLLCNWRVRLEKHRKVRRANIQKWLLHMPANLFPFCIDPLRGSLIRLPVLAVSKQERDDFVKRSEMNGTGIMPTYPTPVNEIPDLMGDFDEQNYPRAIHLSQCLMTLPVHEYVLDCDRNRIQYLLNT